MKEKLLKEGLKRRLLSIVLALAMVFSLLPMNSTVAKVEEITPTPLTFTAEAANSSVTFNWKSGENVQYSRDGGSDWIDYTAGDTITLANIDDRVSFKGTNVVTNTSNHFSMTGTIAASGDVTSLTNGVGGDIVLASRCCFGMFYGCTNLISAPLLPATTLADYCYDEMFRGCTSLTSAPELTAMTLADKCYYEMFRDLQA